MKQEKSKAPFMILAIIAVFLMSLVAILIVEQLYIYALLAFILMIVFFGVGFTLKKKYRENQWL